MKSVTETIADLLRLGLSQADIGRAIKLHHSQVSRWTAGKAPRHATAIRDLYALHSRAVSAVGVPRKVRK
jgi:transcriptional regulator with XRE-family HTH domain